MHEESRLDEAIRLAEADRCVLSDYYRSDAWVLRSVTVDLRDLLRGVELLLLDRLLEVG